MFSNIRTAVGIVTFAMLNTKGYGFVMDGATSVFVRAEVVDAAGFDRADFKIDSSISLEYEQKKDGKYRAVRILQVGDKLAPAYFTIKQRVDHHNGMRIDKVTEVGDVRFAAYRVIDAEGNLVSTESSLGIARDKIGKTINPPVPFNAGKKTNVGGEGHVKGPSGQSGPQSSKGKGKGSKAA